MAGATEGTAVSSARIVAVCALMVMAVAACASGESGGDERPPLPSAQDFAVTMQQCLSDEGWEVEVSWDGGIEFSLPADQTDQFMAAQQVCLERTGYDRPMEYTLEEAASLYDELLEVADCVRDLGYAVADPPSRQAYAEQLARGEHATWHPYYGAGATSPDEVREKWEACPHLG
jgi:hypothetical protein